MSDSDSSSSDGHENGEGANRGRAGGNRGIELDEGTSHPGQTRQSILRFRQAVLDKLPRILDTYEYRPLREAWGEEIRVLVLEPGKKDETIKVRLVPSALADTCDSGTKAYKFNALSYFWGQGNPIDEIEVSSFKNPYEKMDPPALAEDAIAAMNRSYREGGKDGTLSVRRNLKSALVHFRDEEKQKILWIDALCINQKNPEERSGQVAKMHRLYANARTVSVWLGDGSTKNPVPGPCFKFLRDILDLENLEKLLGELKTQDNKLESAMDVIRLMRNKWFSRRWVVQELALARKANVVYGGETMSWSDFSDAIAIFIKCKDQIVPPVLGLLQRTQALTAETMAAKSIEDLGANILVDFTNSCFRRDIQGKILQRMMSLEILVSSLLPFEATDARDTIYAVLSLANDTHKKNQDLDPRLQPDYKRKLILDVYTNFITYCAETSKSLDILLHHWATQDEVDRTLNLNKKGMPPQKQKLPSWIPLIKDSSHGTPQQRPKGRSAGDGFVWNSFETSHKNYCATLELQPDFMFGEKDSEEGKAQGKVCDGCLFVQGLEVGIIDSLTARAAQGIIFKEALELAGFDADFFSDTRHWSPNTKRVPEEFWRTLVADRGPGGINAPSWYPRACVEALRNRESCGDIQPDEVIKLPCAPGVCKDFLERVKNVIMGRKFARIKLEGIKTERTKTYGLLPGKTMDRDIICVLFGCSVPVVLRPHENDTYYEMIGECFIYGIMQGEAVADLEPSRLLETSKRFELR